MRSASALFKQALAENKRNYLVYADITLSNDQTISFDNITLWSSGFSTEDAVSSDESFTAVGATIINAASITINNITGAYTNTDFKGAEVILRCGLALSNGVTELLKLGTYDVEDTTYNGATITLSLLDRMAQFERPYSASTRNYPATLDQIVREACQKCDVPLNTFNFPHKNFVVQSRPEADAVTFREVIGWAAAIAGCYARCNADGQLELKWFDTSGDADHEITSLFSQDICLDDTVITGVVVETTDTESSDLRTFIHGSAGHVITISGNEFITASNAQTVADLVGNDIIGLQFRKLRVTTHSDPTREAGDTVAVTDHKGNSYFALITRCNFHPFGRDEVVSGSDRPERNSATRYSSATKSYVEARKLLKHEKTLREQQLENLAGFLTRHTGLYFTKEITENGNIYYLHNQPDLSDSMIIWKMTADAWAVSTDGGETWNAGMTAEGDIVARVLTATGINADWINAGTFTVEDINGRLLFEASKDLHRVYISGDNVQIGGEPLASALATIDENAESRARTWYQETDPALEWDNLLDHNGEPILDHNVSTEHPDGLPFELVSDPGKNGHIGDIWQMISDDPALNGTIWLYTESGWVTNAYTTLQGVKNNLTQQDIFEKLTGGSPGGLYLLNGRVYLDATYINVGDGANLYSNYDTMAQIPNDRDSITWRANDDTNGNIQSFELRTSTRISGNMLRIQNKETVTSSGGYVFLGNSENHYGLVRIQMNKMYRISFFAQNVNTNQGELKPWIVKTNDWDSKPANSACYSREVVEVGNNWDRYSFVYDNSSNNGNTPMFYFGLGFANLTANTAVNICGIMIEEVDNESQAPSPFAPAGTTQINGGTIKTESIDATSIKAKSLTSDQIDVVGGWHINANSIQSNGTWSMPGESVTHPKIEMLKNGELKIGDVTLDNNYGALRIQYGLELYTTSDPDILSDGSGQFRIYNIRGGSGITGQALGITSSDVVGVLAASSRRYKDPCGLTSQEDAERILSLPVIRFKYKDGYLMKGDQMEGKEMPGFYAEDVAEILPEAAIYDEEGRPEDWNHRILIPAMLKLIQSQHDMITELEDRISRLEKLLIKESD